MALDVNSIADETSTVPANSEEASTDIPAEVLELPIMRGLLEGAPPAVWAPIGTKGPEVATVLKHGPALIDNGFGFFRDEKNKLDVFFNRRFISPELIEKAAEKGELKEVASPLLEVSAELNGSVGQPAGVMDPSAIQAGTSGATLPETPQNTARLNNLQPGGPTEGPRPGAGRVLNNILKPAF